MPVIFGLTPFRPRRTGASRVEYSGLIIVMSGIWRARIRASASRSRIVRPSLNPAWGQRGASAEEHDDPIAQPVKPLERLPFEPDRKSEQHDHRHRAPGDPEYGQDRAQTLSGKVRPQLPDHVDEPHGFSTARGPR